MIFFPRKINTHYILITIFALSAFSTVSYSQPYSEFWLDPDKFFYKRGETINLRCRAGENFAGENWTGNRSDIKSMFFYFGGVKDSCNTNYPNGKGDSLQLALLDEGTAMITMNTENSISQTEADEFATYLKDEGLNSVIDMRIKYGDTLNAVSEFYQRSSKTIIQVGENRDKTFKVLTNLPIDIIPDDNPYHVSKDDHFKIRVLFKKTVLRNHQVKVWHRQNDKTSVQVLTTDDDGEVKFFLTPSGKWMVTTVYMEKLDNDPKAGWQSYWGSLTWGYD